MPRKRQQPPGFVLESDFDLTKIDWPDLDLSKIDWPDLDLSKIDWPDLDLSKIDWPDLDPSKIEWQLNLKLELPELGSFDLGDLPSFDLGDLVFWPISFLYKKGGANGGRRKLRKSRC